MKNAIALVIVVLLLAIAGWFFFLNKGSGPVNQPPVAAPTGQQKAPAAAPAVLQPDSGGLQYFPTRKKEELDLGEPPKIDLPFPGTTQQVPGKTGGQQPQQPRNDAGKSGFSIPLFSGVWDTVSMPLNLIGLVAGNWWVILIAFVIAPWIIGGLIKKIIWGFPFLLWEIFQTIATDKKIQDLATGPKKGKKEK